MNYELCIMHYALISPSSSADDACADKIVEQGGEGGDSAGDVCHESGVEDGARMFAFGWLQDSRRDERFFRAGGGVPFNRQRDDGERDGRREEDDSRLDEKRLLHRGAAENQHVGEFAAEIGGQNQKCAQAHGGVVVRFLQCMARFMAGDAQCGEGVAAIDGVRKSQRVD